MSPHEVADSRLSRLITRARSAVLVRSTGGRPAPLVEAAVLALVILLFSRLHAAAGKDVVAATAHARALQALERALHLNVELTANQWLTAHLSLILPAVFYYRLYYVAIIGVLVWTYLRRADVYVKVRRTLVAMSVLVLPVFWALPMSPPRFALPGIVDIVARHDLLTSRPSGSGQNLYSAMPSMHMGWSLWCAYAVWCGLRPSHPRLAWLAWIFPLGMAAVVLTTGNHYVLDIAGSAVLLIVSIAAVRAWNTLTRHLRT
ncbi:phosphatase PAP2 family protein [Nonomuraea spiralis]|uniref:phosphatase PAP2 family protein n=1 Tax=Nonomuraea spiralis TaxID=46182 RepID=UPI00379D7C63